MEATASQSRETVLISSHTTVALVSLLPKNAPSAWSLVKVCKQFYRAPGLWIWLGAQRVCLRGKLCYFLQTTSYVSALLPVPSWTVFVVHPVIFTQTLLLGTQALFVRPTRNARLQNPFRTKSTPGLVELTCVPVWLVKLLEKTVARLDWWRGEQHALSGRYWEQLAKLQNGKSCKIPIFEKPTFVFALNERLRGFKRQNGACFRNVRQILGLYK